MLETFYLWLSPKNHSHKTFKQLSKHYSYELTLPRLDIVNMALDVLYKKHGKLDESMTSVTQPHYWVVGGQGFHLSLGHLANSLILSLQGKPEKDDLRWNWGWAYQWKSSRVCIIFYKTSQIQMLANTLGCSIISSLNGQPWLECSKEFCQC